MNQSHINKCHSLDILPSTKKFVTLNNIHYTVKDHSYTVLSNNFGWFIVRAFGTINNDGFQYQKRDTLY